MLDFDLVRVFYFDPPPHDSERIPSREELYARYERQRFERCLFRGGDPEAEGLGPDGSLIGGPSKPLTLFHGFPELRAKLHPLPLSWFDHPRARTPITPPAGIQEANSFFHALSSAYLAGVPDRPSGALLRRYFRSADLSGQPCSRVWHVLACIQTFELRRLLARGAVSLYEVARAIHLSKIRRASVVSWINQFAVRPGDRAWPGPEASTRTVSALIPTPSGPEKSR